MKWLPGFLFALAAIGFFIAGAIGKSGAAFVAVGASCLVLAMILFQRASAKR